MQTALRPGQTPDTLRRRLQAETREIHEALHVHPLLAPLNDPSITREQYITILKAFYSFYSQHEPLFAARDDRFAAEAHPTALLEQDFTALGVVLPVAAATQWERRPATDAEYLGYLYVKQGSTLGGQVIAKNLIRSLGLEPGQSLFFFYGAGPLTGPNWKEFERYLDARPADLSDDAIVAAAKTAFISLYDHLEGFIDA